MIQRNMVWIRRSRRRNLDIPLMRITCLKHKRLMILWWVMTLKILKAMLSILTLGRNLHLTRTDNTNKNRKGKERRKKLETKVRKC